MVELVCLRGKCILERTHDFLSWCEADFVSIQGMMAVASFCLRCPLRSNYNILACKFLRYSWCIISALHRRSRNLQDILTSLRNVSGRSGYDVAIDQIRSRSWVKLWDETSFWAVLRVTVGSLKGISVGAVRGRSPEITDGYENKKNWIRRVFSDADIC